MKYVVIPVLLLASGAVSAQEFPPAKVEVASAEMRDMAPSIEVSGTVVSLNDSQISAEVSGVLRSLADIGDAVDAGDLIARIDPRLIRVAVKRAEANVARLEADYAYRDRQLTRQQGLAQSNSVSETLLDESMALRDQALHQLNDARAQLELAQSDLERSVVRAAFAGHVTERLASVGEYVGVGDGILRLVDTHRTEISIPAPIALTAYLEPGLNVRVTSGGVERLHEVRAVVPVGDAVSRMVEVRLNTGDGDWLVGTPVQVSLPRSAPVTTVAVPRDALVERGGQVFIYKVNDEDTAEQVRAEVQSMVGLWAGIASGIDAGDQVIVRGAERLSPGQQVEVVSSQVSAR